MLIYVYLHRGRGDVDVSDRHLSSALLYPSSCDSVTRDPWGTPEVPGLGRSKEKGQFR